MLIQQSIQFTRAVILLLAVPHGLLQPTTPLRSNGRMKFVATCPQLISFQLECTLAHPP